MENRSALVAWVLWDVFKEAFFGEVIRSVFSCPMSATGVLFQPTIAFGDGSEK